DKTGTLTQNQMTVRKLATLEREYSVTGEGYEERGNVEYQGKSFEPGSDNILRTLIETGFLCNHSSIEKEKDGLTVLGDPTEGALVVLASKAGIKDKIKIEREIPFDSDRKMMSMVVKKDGTYRVYVKGALDVLLPRCIRVSSSKGDFPLSDKNQRHFSDLQEAWAGLAYRVLGFAYRSLSPGEVGKANDEQLESDLTLLGICGIIDPPRPAVFGAVQECLQAGIIPIMVTGDHPATALAIARQIGIYETGEVIGPAEIDRMSSEELAAAAMKVRVFARVSPQHKFKIVKALKKKGHVVAMTGDGVNDAPAVREADIGVSMGIAGTEVTREASSMILADDDFATIVAAVHEGRSIFDNIRKFIRYLLGCNIGEVLTMFLSSLLGMPLPLLPIQILWVNLVTDGLPAMALGLEPPEPEIMKRAPRKGNESIFSRGMGWLITGRGIFIAISTLLIMVIGLTYTGLKGSQGLELARTMALTNLVFAQLFYVFECRSERYSPFDLGFLSNPYLVGAVLCSVTMQLLAVYLPVFNRIFGTTPLQAWHWGIILIIAGSGLIIKFLRYLISLVAGNRLGYVKLENVEAVTK
ncbi:MAG: cation-translocating P-type ATPase, partial [Chitinophagales bacterium]